MSELREEVRIICERLFHSGHDAAFDRKTDYTPDTATDAIMALIGWRPIESAPHGVEVLLYCPFQGCVSNRERIELDYASHGDVGRHSYHSWATHWMPLPHPPENTHPVQPAP
jgi:hypothetical protein